MMKKVWVCAWVLLSLASASVQQERFRKSPPIPDPFPQLGLPAVESTRLMNGLTLAVVSRPDQPFVSLELIIMAGESRSPQNLPGLASFTAEMLSRGTPFVSAAELEDRIDAIGGDLSTTTTPDFCRFSLRFLDGYLEQALETLSLMLLQSNFSDREIVALKRTQFYDLKEKQRDPEFAGRRQLLRILFKGHPYGRSLFNEDVFKNIAKKDVQAFYQAYYRPNNALIVLAGNLDMAVAMKGVSHFLNTWPGREIEPLVLPVPAPNAEERDCLVDLPGAQAATLVIGNVIIPQVESDQFPLAVLNQILGGTPLSRLFMNLREAKGYAYSASSRLEFFRNCGLYELNAAVIPPAASSSVREIMGELERISRNRVSNFELEQAKSYLIGHFPLQVGHLDQLSRRLSEILAFSLGEAQWGRFNENISSVDADRIFEAAQRYFLLKPVVVIVGDKDTLLEHLRDLDRLEVYDLKGTLIFTLIKGVEG